jgi:hypothetical protein
MRYMMMIGGDEGAYDALDAEERQRALARIGEWWEAHAAAGRIVEGHELQPSSTATTVRIAEGNGVTITDGPFIESSEMIGGYAILDVPDLDAAIALASGWPGVGTVLEVRPIVDHGQD